MFQLENGHLRVDVLDPVADAARLGPRYCWGGYIWQVHDPAAGPLLTGPEWPEAAPVPFNGQGLPESFRHRSLDGRPFTWRGDSGVALGAGELERDAAGNVTLTRPCVWQVKPQPARIIFTTRHETAGFSYELGREIALIDREVRSTTQLTNTSAAERLTLEWFAHPFFALVDGLARATVPAGTDLPENPGFVLSDAVSAHAPSAGDRERTLTQRRRFISSADGHMDRGLRLPANRPLGANLAHPTVGYVQFATSVAPDSCVIWGNDRTFSLEPYLALDLGPGESRSWHLTYRFGASSGISRSNSTSRTSVPR
jgi:hypothetical protein